MGSHVISNDEQCDCEDGVDHVGCGQYYLLCERHDYDEAIVLVIGKEIIIKGFVIFQSTASYYGDKNHIDPQDNPSGVIEELVLRVRMPQNGTQEMIAWRDRLAGCDVES